MNGTIEREANYSLWYWKLYYHLLLYLHFFLGIAGVVIGALIATGDTDKFVGLGSQSLGVLSTVIVGIVSFIQPGRMASVFYDAYWRLRIAVLRSENGSSTTDDLITALSDGYTSVATIQPEALRKHKQDGSTLDVSNLSIESREMLVEKLEELTEQEKAASEPGEGHGLRPDAN